MPAPAIGAGDILPGRIAAANRKQGCRNAAFHRVAKSIEHPAADFFR